MLIKTCGGAALRLGSRAGDRCAAAWAQPADTEGQHQGCFRRALLQRIEELEASQKQMQAQIELLRTDGECVRTGSPDRSDFPAETAVAQAAQARSSLLMKSTSPRSGPWNCRASATSIWPAWFEQHPRVGSAVPRTRLTVGDFDLFTNTRISDHLSVLGELLITSDFTNETSTEIDRMLLTYSANKYFQISFGKYNTAIGYYTNEFHRAHLFQTAISRPIMYSDEDDGGILPVHNIGITATGMIPSGLWDCTGWRRSRMAGRRRPPSQSRISWMRTTARR